MKFSPQGQFLAAYPFGWDVTPAIYLHDGSYSIVTKENHYGDRGSYCDDSTICPPDRSATDPANPEAHFITQLSKNLVPEWQFQNTNTLSCSRDAGGRVTCVSDHPHGFEWCINAPALDGSGVVYGTSEDGNLYAINQGGGLRDQFFLQLAVGAAYTPLAIGGDGRIYSENNGHLLVTGSGPGSACVASATTLCIDDQPGDARFAVNVQYRTTQAGGLAGDGQAIPLASLGVDHGGLFWFFGATNPEMLIKVLNACGLNQKFWVFYAATTNVGLLTTVLDTKTGIVNTYMNPDLTPAPPVQDTSAFACSTGAASPATEKVLAAHRRRS